MRFMFAFFAPTPSEISAIPSGLVPVTCSGVKAGDKIISATGTVFTGGAGVNLLELIAPIAPADNLVVFNGSITIPGQSIPEQPIIILIERPE